MLKQKKYLQSYRETADRILVCKSKEIITYFELLIQACANKYALLFFNNYVFYVKTLLLLFLFFLFFGAFLSERKSQINIL